MLIALEIRTHSRKSSEKSGKHGVVDMKMRSKSAKANGTNWMFKYFSFYTQLKLDN